MLAQITSVVSTSAPSREQFAVISFSILKQLHHCCSRSEIIVYNALALHADPSGHCWPGRARLAMLTNLSETRVSKATSGLERKGLLRKTSSAYGRVDYWLLPVSESPPPSDQNGTLPVTETAPRTEQLTDQPTERAVLPEPEPPPPPEPPPEPVRPALSKCEIQTRAPLPEGWTLPEAWAEEARDQRPDLADVLETVAANFADYHASKATRSSCWQAEWRRWWRRERSPRAISASRPAPRGPQPPSDRRYPTPEQRQPTPAEQAHEEALLAHSLQQWREMCVRMGVDPVTGLKVQRE